MSKPELIRDIFQPADKITVLGGTNQTKHKFTRGELFEQFTDSSGRPILKKIASNTVVLGGAILGLEKLCGVTAEFEPTTLNDIYGVTVTGTPTGNNTIALFGAGTGGAGLEFGSVVAPDIKQRDVLDLVPMRYGTAVTGDEAAKYFFKKENADGTTNSWYLKEFDKAPVIHSMWKNSIDSESDGTEITSDVHDSNKTEGIETFAEFNISLNPNDIREYFEATGKVNMARYNTVGFYTGERVGDEYANVRLFSVVTFNNRDVSVKTSAKFIYRLYSLI